MKEVPRNFFMQDVCSVAKKLLGCAFVRELSDGSRLAGRIVETEAYAHSNDPASHSRSGKTPRNAVMFGPPGHLYVYFTYGMHYCCNVVTGAEGRGEAILLRALEPLSGIALMAVKRYGKKDMNAREVRDLSRGPARLCRAFGIGREQNGADLCSGEFRILQADPAAEIQIGCSSRIGIREGCSHPWRFYIQNNPWVSGPARNVQA